MDQQCSEDKILNAAQMQGLHLDALQPLPVRAALKVESSSGRRIQPSGVCEGYPLLLSHVARQ